VSFNNALQHGTIPIAVGTDLTDLWGNHLPALCPEHACDGAGRRGPR
jgi:hypothetical protein